MYAWEIPFQKVVGEKRMEELKQVRLSTLIRTLFLGFMIFTERTALFITILVFVLAGNAMSANVVSKHDIYRIIYKKKLYFITSLL